MFALYILNYPLTDSNYFWHIKTVSVNDLKEGDDTITTSFKGVHSEIKDNLNFSTFKALNFIIDLENKKQPIISISENSETNEINSLLKYIDIILNKTQNIFLKKTPFSEAIQKLKKDVKKILKEIKEKDKENPKNDESFFYINNKISQNNKQIQEKFYDFILNILVELNKDYTFDSTFTYPVIKKINDNPRLCDEAKIFLNYSRNTIKYASYFQFLMNFNVYEGIKLSLLFSDEFVNLKKKEYYKQIEEEKKISYFDIMDSFFTQQKENTYNLNSLNMDFYVTHLLSKPKNINKNIFKFFTLNKEIIKKFVYTKKNKDNYTSLKPPDDIVIKPCSKSCFHFTIQDYFTRRAKVLTVKYYLRGSFQYIVATCIPLFSEKKFLDIIDEYLLNTKKMQYFERYYIFLILNTINKYHKLNLEKNTFPEMNNINTKKYFQKIQSYLKENSIIQDEIIFKLFKKNYLMNEKPKENKEDFSYICDDSNFSNDIKNDLIFKDKIIFKRGSKLIEFTNNTNDEEKIPLIFIKSYSYYETCCESNFNVINLNVKEIAEKIVNLIGFFIKLKKEKKIDIEQNMSDILFYLLNCLMYYEDKVKEFNTKK